MANHTKLPTGNRRLRKINIEKGQSKPKRVYSCGSKNCNFSTSEYNELCDHRQSKHYCGKCNTKCVDTTTHKCRCYKQPMPLPNVEVKDTLFTERAKTVKGAVVSLVHDYHVHIIKLKEALDLVYSDLYKLLQTYIASYKGIRVKFTFKLDVTELKTQKRMTRYYQSPYTRLINQAFITEVCLANYDYVDKTVIMLTQSTSGIKIEGVLALQVDIAAYQPIFPRGYHPLPKELKFRHGLLNIKTNDNCFMLCVLAALYGDMVGIKKCPNATKEQLSTVRRQVIKRKLQVPSTYKPIIKHVHENRLLDFNGFEGTFDINKIGEFEEKNLVSISIYAYDAPTRNIKPLKYTTRKFDRHVNLLLLGDGNDAHFVLIQDISKFLGKDGSHRIQICPHCSKRFRKANHLEECKMVNRTGYRFVQEKDKFYKFRDLHKLLPPPYRIYSELLYYQKANDSETSTLDVAGYGILVCGPIGQIVTSEYYIGNDAMKKYLDLVFSYASGITQALHYKLPIPNMSAEEYKQFLEKTNCEVCQQPFTAANPKTRHHSHFIPGYPVQAVCQNDNLQIQTKSYIPLISHTHQRIGHCMILQNLQSKHNKKVYIVPKSNESFMSITFDRKLRLVDGRNFLDMPLQDLVDWLVKSKVTRTLEPHYDELSPEVLHTPMYFPTTWFTSMDKLEEKNLPSLSDYHDICFERDIGEKEYESMRKVYKDTNCTTFKDFCLLYLKSRVMQLSAVFEEFGKWCMETYTLSPLHDISLAGYAFSLANFHSKEQFEIPTDAEIVTRILKNVRGGMSYLSKRIVNGKSERLGHINVKNEERCEILIADVNAMYQFCMLKSLPYKDYKMLSPDEYEHLDINTLTGEDGFGYVFFVNLDYPTHVMQNTMDLPLCPSKEKLDWNYLTENKNDMEKACETSSGHDIATNTLLFSHLPKTDQGIYYKLLQFYLKHGLVITKILAVMRFQEKPFLRDFITKNLNVRKTNPDKFYQQISKRIGNLVFGKFLSINNSTSVKVITTFPDAIRSLSRHDFKDAKIVSSDLFLGYFDKPNIFIDKNILLPFVVLELSKLHLYQLIYDHLKPVFRERLYVCSVETDNFVCSIRDPQNRFLDDLESLKEIFDFSSLPENHRLFDNSRAREAGLLKVEYPYVLQFVGIRPKLYSILNRCQTCLEKESFDGNLDCDKCTGKNNIAKGGPKRAKTPHDVYVKAAMAENSSADYITLHTRDQNITIQPTTRKIYSTNNRQRNWLNYNESLPFGYVFPQYKNGGW